MKPHVQKRGLSMSQFKVLIVDDEINIINGLALLIERYLPECRIVGMAYDGEQGIHQALVSQPDIVLTDIRMPQADGIALIRRLKEAGSQARFIILSGYTEFEYAKSAISLGVEDYILKPVEEDELCAVIKKVCASLEMQNQQIKQIREYGLREILTASGERRNIRLKLSVLDFSLDAERYLCVVWEYDDREEKPALAGLKESAAKCLDFCRTVLTVPFLKSLAVLILVYDKENEEKPGKAVIRMKQQLSKNMDMEFSVGIGLSCSRPEGICESFEEARCALNYKVIKGSGSVISYKEIQNLQTNQTLVDMQDVKQLEDCIDSMDDSGCRRAVDQIFKKLEHAGDVSLTDLQILSLNLVLSGIRKIPFMQFQLNSYLGINILSLESISRFRTVEQLKNWIVNMLKSMNELMLKENLPQRRDIVAEIKEYINKNYNQEISLNDIADRFYMNPYYLSQLFKKRTGETYQKYLTDIRMNRARKLLEETDLKIYEISEIIGYNDSNYFSRVFERQAGMKPLEYRTGEADCSKAD